MCLVLWGSTRFWSKVAVFNGHVLRGLVKELYCRPGNACIKVGKPQAECVIVRSVASGYFNELCCRPVNACDKVGAPEKERSDASTSRLLLAWERT